MPPGGRHLPPSSATPIHLSPYGSKLAGEISRRASLPRGRTVYHCAVRLRETLSYRRVWAIERQGESCPSRRGLLHIPPTRRGGRRRPASTVGRWSHD